MKKYVDILILKRRDARWVPNFRVTYKHMLRIIFISYESQLLSESYLRAVRKK